MGMFDQYLSVSDIMALYAMSRSHVYKKASEGEWRRVRIDGGVRYHVADVASSLVGKAGAESIG